MTDWHVSGTVLIACNCDWGCPCNFNAPPTTGDCEGGWTWSIDTGHVDDIRLDGLTIAVFADWLGAIHDGGGQASAYIDDRAGDYQAHALARLVRGELGGPWAIFINTYELDGPHRAQIDLSLNGYATTLTIRHIAELALQPIRNPVTGAEAHPEMGAAPRDGPETRLARRVQAVRVHDGVHYDHSGQYAAFGRFDYS